MTLGGALVAAGLLQFVIAWVFFRHPGQRLWVIAPIWRASQFLSPAGVALWISGLTLAWVGVLSVLIGR
jgi:hypothetical protein